MIKSKPVTERKSFNAKVQNLWTGDGKGSRQFIAKGERMFIRVIH